MINKLDALGELSGGVHSLVTCGLSVDACTVAVHFVLIPAGLFRGPGVLSAISLGCCDRAAAIPYTTGKSAF
jgi:hypothetical protein